MLKFALPVLLALAGCESVDTETRIVGTNEGATPVGEASVLTVTNGSGDLTIQGNASGEVRVLVTVDTVEDSSSRDAAALAAAPAMPETVGGGIAVTAAWSLPDGYGSMVQVDAPGALRLVVADRSGDLEISDWQGDVEITDHSGDIILNNVGSYRILSDTSGDVIVDGINLEEDD